MQTFAVIAVIAVIAALCIVYAAGIYAVKKAIEQVNENE